MIKTLWYIFKPYAIAGGIALVVFLAGWQQGRQGADQAWKDRLAEADRQAAEINQQKVDDAIAVFRENERNNAAEMGRLRAELEELKNVEVPDGDSVCLPSDLVERLRDLRK